MIYYWLSVNLYIGTDGHYYRIDNRKVSARTWVQEVPVRIRVEDIIKRGKEPSQVEVGKGMGDRFT